jgi:hypothetical protein
METARDLEQGGEPLVRAGNEVGQGSAQAFKHSATMVEASGSASVVWSPLTLQIVSSEESLRLRAAEFVKHQQNILSAIKWQEHFNS